MKKELKIISLLIAICLLSGCNNQEVLKNVNQIQKMLQMAMN